MRINEFWNLGDFDQWLLEGTYSSMRLTGPSQKIMKAYQAHWQIQDAVPPELMHVTVISSPHADVNFDLYQILHGPITIKKSTFGLAFKGFGAALVLTFDSDKLTQQYQRSLDSGSKPKFPVFRPHITLSYNSEKNSHLIGRLEPPDSDLQIIGERPTQYSETTAAKFRELSSPETH